MVQPVLWSAKPLIRKATVSKLIGILVGLLWFSRANLKRMDEQYRLLELDNYRILDTLPEKELDEITEIASAICDTPISLISLIDEHRQWFKARKGLDVVETPREDAFCQHTLQRPQEVLVVDDPLHDERFKDNPLVQGDPHIRFYAGAPLETPTGHVMGTLCVIDNQPRSISENQKRALQLLARRVMDYLETRKLLLEQGDKIELDATRLKKLTDQAPGAIFQFEMTPDGEESFSFVSQGIAEIHPCLNPERLQENVEAVFAVVHPEDVGPLRESIRASYRDLTPWSYECRMVSDDNSVSWCWGNAKPERKEDGTVVWYGTLQNTTDRKEYTKTLERVLFDISHTIRRPVATMLGLTALIEQANLDQPTLAEVVGHLKTVSQEMDVHIKTLNTTYLAIQAKFSSRYDDQNR